MIFDDKNASFAPGTLSTSDLANIYSVPGTSGMYSMPSVSGMSDVYSMPGTSDMPSDIYSVPGTSSMSSNICNMPCTSGRPSCICNMPSTSNMSSDICDMHCSSGRSSGIRNVPSTSAMSSGIRNVPSTSAMSSDICNRHCTSGRSSGICNVPSTSGYRRTGISFNDFGKWKHLLTPLGSNEHVYSQDIPEEELSPNNKKPRVSSDKNQSVGIIKSFSKKNQKTGNSFLDQEDRLPEEQFHSKRNPYNLNYSIPDKRYLRNPYLNMAVPVDHHKTINFGDNCEINLKEHLTSYLFPNKKSLSESHPWHSWLSYKLKKDASTNTDTSADDFMGVDPEGTEPPCAPHSVCDKMVAARAYASSIMNDVPIRKSISVRIPLCLLERNPQCNRKCTSVRK